VKFVVGTYGTKGDARPFAALCRGLMDAGHEARLLADADRFGSAQALSVHTTALGGDIRGSVGADHAVAGAVAHRSGCNAPQARWRRSSMRMPNPDCALGEACDAILPAGWPRLLAFPRPSTWASRHDPDHANRRVPCRWPANARLCGQPPAQALPANFVAVGDTPQDPLFPHTAAVTDHGRSGISHSAACAGVSSIVTPFGGDQFFWAERLRLADVAPAAVDGRRPRAEAFTRALAAAQVRNRARLLGEAKRAEDGVSDTVAALERITAS
jgi:UDP:flavonoid glycosyltransferase YjiC (YdhE family)